MAGGGALGQANLPLQARPEAQAQTRSQAPRETQEPGAAGRLRALARLPRDLAWSRLTYGLKRPFYALPLYRLLLAGPAPTALRASLGDPWPGDAERGALLIEGAFPLAGRTLPMPARPWSPLGGEPEWLAALHGFDWLRDLRALGGDAARRRGRELVGDWLEAFDRWDRLAWAPEITGRRLASWLGQYDFFADSAEVAFQQRLLASLARQARHLERVLPAGLAGAELIAAIKGLSAAGACLPGGERWLKTALALLRRELPRQILADGGHAARNPETHMAVLRDLIDIRAALHAAPNDAPDSGPNDGPNQDGIETPPDLQTTIAQMAPMLRLFRHGDGGLALFNGGGESEGWRIDMVLQRAGGRSKALSQAPQSGFQRLHAGRTVVLVDAGAPPPPGLDGEAHAGTLGFEMSCGRKRLIVNCGAHPARRAWGQSQRATAAHSTLVVDDINSSRISGVGVPGDGGFAQRPAQVTCRREDGEGIWLDMSHDGYRRRRGLVHHRRLYLSANGEDLRGEDRLEGASACPFAIRFHLHPEVRATLTQDGTTVLLSAGRAGGWRFQARGATLSLEPSVYLGRPEAARRNQQIVLAGHGSGGGSGDDTTVKWALRKEAKAPAKSPAKTGAKTGAKT